MAPNTDTNQNRRIDDRLPEQPLDWEDPEVKHARESTRLANAMAEAGAAFLAHMDTGGVIAQIPNTSQYVVAGTLAMIAKVLPADAPIPPLTAPAPTDEAKWKKFAAFTAREGLHGEAYDLAREAFKIGCEPPAAPAPQQSELSADEIVTSLYRRFKDWSKRGFGPDDVTWCEVRAEVIALIAKAAPAAPVQTAQDCMECGGSGEMFGGFYCDECNGSGKVAAPVQAEQAQAEPSDDDKYAVIVDRRDLFDFLRAAWRAGQEFFGPMTEQECWERATNYANTEIKGWSTMRAAPAVPAQAEQVAAARAAALTEASEAIRTVIWNIENDNGLRDEIYGAERCRDAVAALATKEAAAQVPAEKGGAA